MAIQAVFKTAHDQRMELVDATSAAPLTLNVGDLVTITSAGVVAIPLDSDSAPADAADIDLTSPGAGLSYAVIAQSDVSLAVLDGARSGPYKHVRVQDKTFQFDSTVVLGTTSKRISIFRVIDPFDVVLYDYTANAAGGRPEQLA